MRPSTKEYRASVLIQFTASRLRGHLIFSIRADASRQKERSTVTISRSIERGVGLETSAAKKARSDSGCGLALCALPRQETSPHPGTRSIPFRLVPRLSVFRCTSRSFDTDGLPAGVALWAFCSSNKAMALLWSLACSASGRALFCQTHRNRPETPCARCHLSFGKGPEETSRAAALFCG